MHPSSFDSKNKLFGEEHNFVNFWEIHHCGPNSSICTLLTTNYWWSVSKQFFSYCSYCSFPWDFTVPLFQTAASTQLWLPSDYPLFFLCNYIIFSMKGSGQCWHVFDTRHSTGNNLFESSRVHGHHKTKSSLCLEVNFISVLLSTLYQNISKQTYFH